MGEASPLNSLGLVKITSPEKAFKHTYALEETASPLNTREHSSHALAGEVTSSRLKGTESL
jgi:hypothetical protein